MQIKINNTQEVVLRLNPVDSDGAPVALDEGAVAIELLGEGTGAPITTKVTRSPEGVFDVVIRSGDGPGTATFLLHGDALPGEGEEIIDETIEVTVVSVAAVSLGITTLEIRKKSPL